VTRWNHITLDDEIPLVPDFRIEVRQMEDLGGLVHFVSDAYGEIAWFPAWEHADRDLRHFVASDVPLGTIDDPYDDRDDGWRIVLFEHGGQVYIFEDDSPNGTRFPRRFRVPRDRYFVAWAAIINEFNPVQSLDDLFQAPGEAEN
jgi:hypothetical protein